MNPAGELATFLRVVDLGSFAAAAAEAGITASGLSRIVTRLETRLGVKLLHRTTRRLVLTQEGETYAARARDILAAIEAAEAEVTAARGRPRGLIRVNTGTAFGTPCAEKITGALVSGISDSSSTNTAPLAFRLSTT